MEVEKESESLGVWEFGNDDVSRIFRENINLYKIPLQRKNAYGGFRTKETD